MAIDVTMPALSPTMEVGTLAKWHVKLGQTVKSGDIIAESRARNFSESCAVVGCAR